MITHGWPGSIVEFHKVIGPLTNPTEYGGDAGDAFHVVCPSLPGFGFSGKPPTTGWGVERIADAWAVLMARLGYDRYFAQGGDWGSAVTPSIGAHDADHCNAIHVTLAMGRGRSPTASRRPRRKRAIAGAEYYQEWDSGYSTQQAPGRRRSATGSPIRPPGRRRGSSRSSGRGPTAMATRRTC